MPFMRGARPTPRHILAAAMPHRTLPGTPASPNVIPAQLNMWGNSTYGDCVTAEEFAAKAMYSVMLGLPELYMPESLAVQWATANGYLNGADLTPVMQSMASPGVTFEGTTYTDGTPTSVNYADWDNLCSAISQGPVKTGVAADQLSNTNAGQANGWYATGWTPDQNEDHCIGLWLFGTPEYIYDVLKLPVPSALTGTTLAEFLGFYTWSTVGCVDFQSVVNVAGEAWLRNSTTPQQAPAPAPSPTPGPTPAPVPSPAYLPNVPSTAGWWDKASGTWHNPSGWNKPTANNVSTAIVVNPNNEVVNVPKGWTAA